MPFHTPQHYILQANITLAKYFYQIRIGNESLIPVQLLNWQQYGPESLYV